MATKAKEPHLRLPQKSGFARGQKDASGNVVERPDPRVASQDPALKTKTAPRDVRGVKPQPS